MIQKTLKLKSTTQNLQTVRDFVAKNARTFGFSEDEVYKIELAVDEACTNIIKHAYHNNETEIIMLHLTFDGKTMEISIFDHGQPFDSAQYHEPDLVNFIKQKKRGGLGIQLIKSLMDKVEYKQVDSQNMVKLVKTLNG